MKARRIHIALEGGKSLNVGGSGWFAKLYNNTLKRSLKLHYCCVYLETSRNRQNQAEMKHIFETDCKAGTATGG